LPPYNKDILWAYRYESKDAKGKRCNKVAYKTVVRKKWEDSDMIGWYLTDDYDDVWDYDDVIGDNKWCKIEEPKWE
jgi:hypothetical protein